MTTIHLIRKPNGALDVVRWTDGALAGQETTLLGSVVATGSRFGTYAYPQGTKQGPRILLGTPATLREAVDLIEWSASCVWLEGEESHADPA